MPNIYKLIVFSVITIGFIANSGSAHAATWPGTQWSSDDADVAVTLEKTDIHADVNSRFAAYLPGNTTTPAGDAFTLTINKVECNLADGAKLVITKPNESPSEYETCDDVPATLVPKRQNGETILNCVNLTRYSYKFEIVNPVNNQSKFHFQIKYDSPVEVGFLGNKSQNKVPISVINKDQNSWPNLSIPIIASNMCTSEKSIVQGDYWFYDFDSYDSGLGAQDNGKWDWPPGKNKPLPGYQFKPLGIGFSLNGSLEKAFFVSGTPGGNPVNNCSSTDPIKWTESGGVYKPCSYTSGEKGLITYNAERFKKYRLHFYDLGGDNYFSFSSPFDEWVKGMENKWVINGALSPANQTVLTGATAKITHSLRNIGPNNTSKSIDGDITGAFGDPDWGSMDMETDSPPRDSTSPNATKERSKSFAAAGLECDTLSFSPSAWNDNAKSTVTGCANVVDPVPNVSDGWYEKGTDKLNISSKINVGNGGSCPTIPITINYDYNIAGTAGKDSFSYGGDSNSDGIGDGCNDKPISVTVPASIIPTLNARAPGITNYKYTLTVNGKTDDGDIYVYEVPFARFYGNDMYATNGGITFNDAGDTTATVQRGSVSQYAALSKGAIKINTAAYRFLPSIDAPKAPDGLDVPLGSVSQLKATKVYDDVVSKLPTSCTAIDSGKAVGAVSDGCYTINSSAYFNNSPGRQIPFIGSGDGYLDGSDTNYNKRITVVNKDPAKMFMIVGNIINSTSAEDYKYPSKTGVLMIVSEGPIVIDNDVRRVDAILVSKKGIYTCGFAGYGPWIKVGNEQIHTTCRVALTVNGALSAPVVDFRRGGGSRYLNSSPGDEQQNCDTSKGIVNCDRSNVMPPDTGKPAEIINFPAYLYYAKPFLNDYTQSGGKVEAMFVAPPRQ